jgi:hypothetical protein
MVFIGSDPIYPFGTEKAQKGSISIEYFMKNIKENENKNKYESFSDFMLKLGSENVVDRNSQFRELILINKLKLY